MNDEDSTAARLRIHPEIRRLVEILERRQVDLRDVTAEPVNRDYGAATARHASRLLRFRVGRQTPARSGHFVATWQRDPTGRAVPYEDSDEVAALIVVVRQGPRSGAFVFTRLTMLALDLVSRHGVGGKNGFRVHAAWTRPESEAGRRAMAAQSASFVDLSRSSETGAAALASRLTEI